MITGSGVSFAAKSHKGIPATSKPTGAAQSAYVQKLPQVPIQQEDPWWEVALRVIFILGLLCGGGYFGFWAYGQITQQASQVSFLTSAHYTQEEKIKKLTKDLTDTVDRFKQHIVWVEAQGKMFQAGLKTIEQLPKYEARKALEAVAKTVTGKGSRES